MDASGKQIIDAWFILWSLLMLCVGFGAGYLTGRKVKGWGQRGERED